MNLKSLILGGVILTAASVQSVPAPEVDRAFLRCTTVAGRLLDTFRYEKSDGFEGLEHGAAGHLQRWYRRCYLQPR